MSNDEGFRIRTEQVLAGDPSYDDPFLCYRTSRFCVDRRLCQDGLADHAHPPFSLPSPMTSPRTASRTSRQPASTADCVRRDRMCAEDDEGDVEYKWRLTGIAPQRFEHLVTQMQFRVREGHGQCLYEIGVRDDGRMEGLPPAAFDESVNTIRRMADVLGFECQEVQRVHITVDDGDARDETAAEPLLCAELLVSRRHAELGAPETSVAFCGTTGSGKSTLMGVLLSESLDDGNGTMSQLLFNHKHEVDSGKTSSMSTRVWSVSCGISTSSHSSNADGATPISRVGPTPSPLCLHESSLSFPRRKSSDDSLADGDPLGTDEHCAATATDVPTALTRAALPCTPPLVHQRFISLLDLGGDITKTTLCGLMSRQPDLVCVCVEAGCANPASAILCAKACRVMNKALAIVVTHIDLLEEFELDSFVMDLSSELEAALSCECFLVESAEDATIFAASHTVHPGGGSGVEIFPSAHATTARLPIFCLSSLSGVGLDLFRGCVTRLPTRPADQPAHEQSTTFEVLLDRRSFYVEGTGPVVSGIVSNGPVPVGTYCFIGPDKDGQFHKVQLRGIHVNGVHVNEARRGDEATFALSEIPADVVLGSKGKVLSSAPMSTVQGTIRLCIDVIAQELKDGAEPVLYARNARQAIRVLEVYPQSPSGGATQTVVVVCEFLYHREVLAVDTPVLLHWAPHGLAVGRVVGI